MEAASAQESEDTMWQGYVSVSSCLLLALLLIMAILAIALVLASAAEKPELERQVQSSPTPRPPSPAKGARWVLDFSGRTVDIGPAQRAQDVPQAQEAPPQPLFVQESPPQGGDKPAAVRWAILRQDSAGEGLVRFDFGPGNSRLSAADDSAVRDTLRKISTAQTAPQWLIWVSVNTRNAVEARQAYQRAMAIRNALIDSGQPPPAIEVRLLDSGQDLQAAGQQTVWLARSPPGNPPGSPPAPG